MSRDHRKLHVFALADRLVFEVYGASKKFPPDERYGLRAEFREAARSAATNIVEGCARRHQNEYVNFLDIAHGSASEARYLSSVASRLNYFSSEAAEMLERDYNELCAGLVALIRALDNRA
jgi:four helix bundle protein